MACDGGEAAASDGSVHDGSDGRGSADLADLKAGNTGGEGGFASSKEAVEDARRVLTKLAAAHLNDEAAAQIEGGDSRDDGGADMAAAATAGEAGGGDGERRTGVGDIPELGVEGR